MSLSGVLCALAAHATAQTTTPEDAGVPEPPRPRAAGVALPEPTTPTAQATVPAEPAAPLYRGIAVPPVVVTGRRRDEPHFASDRTLHRLDRASLVGAAGSAEAISTLPAVHVQQTNRGAGAPFLRGLVGPQNLLVVDGLRFSNSTFRTGPNQYLTLLDPGQADRFEVLLGPGSVLYGSDAMGGVLQLVPPAFRGAGMGGRAGLRLASVDTAGAAWGEVQHTGGAWAGVLGGAVRRFGSLATGGGGTALASDYTQDAWHTRARWQPLATVDVTANVLGARVGHQGRTDQLHKGQVRWYDNASDFGWLDATWRPSARTQGRLALALHRTAEAVEAFRCTLGKGNAAILADSAQCVDAARHGYDAGRHGYDADGGLAGPLTRQESNNDTVWSPGLTATGHWASADSSLRLLGGAEAHEDRVGSHKRERRADKGWAWQDAVRGSFSDGSTWRQWGAFAHADWDAWSAGDRMLTASAGVRGVRIEAHAPAVPALGDIDYDHTGVVGSASLRYLMADRALGYLSVSQGFRAPNLQESTVLGDTGSKFEVPNQDLQPERSDTVELGGRLALPKLTLHAAGYLSRLDAAIDERKLAQSEFAALGITPADVGCKAFDDPACKPKPVVQRVNAERGLVRGLEGTLEVGPWHAATLWLRGTWLRGDLETPSLGLPAGTEVPMRRMPPPQGAAGLRVAGGAWRAEVATRFSATQERLHPSDEDDLRMCENPAVLGSTYKATPGAAKCPGTPGWVALDARVGVDLGTTFKADLALTNALDARYKTHGSGVDAPGRNVVVTLTGER